MAGGVSEDYLLLIFRNIEHPMTVNEIKKMRGAEVDSFVVKPMVESGVHYELVCKVAGKFFPSEALLEYGIARMQKSQEWLDSLVRQRESLGGKSV